MVCRPKDNASRSRMSIPLEVEGEVRCEPLHGLLNLLQALWPLLPVVHNDLGLGDVSEELAHLVHLLLTLLDVVDADVGNEWDAGTRRRSSTGLGVFDGDTLLWLDAELLACVEVDGRVWFGGWRAEGGGCRVDVLIREEA